MQPKLKRFIKNLIAKIPNKHLQNRLKNFIKAIYSLSILPKTLFILLTLNKSFKKRLNTIIKFSLLYNYDLKGECYIEPNLSANLLTPKSSIMGGGSY